MADVQSQVEVNGLPTKFESTSDRPAEDHIAANITATISNSEKTAASDVKSTTIAPLESSTLVEPASPTKVTAVPVSQPVDNGNQAPLTNGNGLVKEAADVGTQVNGHGASHLPETVTASDMTENVVPSSIPSDDKLPTTVAITADTLTAPISNPIPESISDTTSSLQQQPISDLRTAPHSDALAPETVAAIEEHKHEEDNNAALTTAPGPASPTMLSPKSEAPIMTETSLPPAPVGSPPPAPEMSHATLPTDQSPATTAPKIDSLPASAPEEKPVAPASTPAIPTKEEDTLMEDAPAPKIAREREEDSDEEPAAKRVKTEEPTSSAEQTEFKMPVAPTASAPAASTNGLKIEGNNTITGSRLVHMKKIISNLKKSKASSAFRVPVDYTALNIPNYPDIVKNPMDLTQIDQKLKNNSYHNVQEFVTDFELIVNNCVLFNGPDHGVTQQAFTMQNSFNNQMQALPPPSAVEQSKAEKKAMKLKAEPMRNAPPRRQSVTAPVVAKSPKVTAPASTPSFAPGPDGIPLIRRDSSIVDGRPKRAIVPPKRNSDFAGVRPKKKKYELQLRFCQEVLKEITSTKHWALNQYFTHPVDPVALNIPTYFQIIKKPMDLGTVGSKLDGNQYEKAKDFEEDVRLVFKNCYKFNPEGDYVNSMGHQLEDLFDRKWAQKDDWIAAREPPSDPPSDAEEDEDEDEEASDDNDVDSEDDRNKKIKELQQQIEMMSKQMGELTKPVKKKKSPPVVAKKAGKPKTKKEKPSSTFPNLKPKDKKKSISKPKMEKDRYVTFAEKQYISNGIGMLPERQMQEALRIIQQSVPSLANSDGEIELDIEEVPNHALLKLLTFVKKFAGPPPDEPETKNEAFATAAPTKTKKNKPMSKTEQEAQIEELKGKLGAYGGPVSPDALQSVEGNESSDDSADSEESEEE